MVNNSEKYPSVEAQVDAIIAQEIVPDFVAAEEVVIFGEKQDGTSIQYDKNGKSRYIAREPGKPDEILRGAVVEDWNFVERGYEEEPRRHHMLVDANDEVCGAISYMPIASAMFNMGADSEAELDSAVLKDITPEEQELLDSDLIPEPLALAQIASDRFEGQRQRSMVSLEGGLVENDGKLAQAKGKIAETKGKIAETKGLIAQHEEKIAEIKANMAVTRAQIEEKQAIVDEYERNKPWFMRIIDFVSDNFLACTGLLVGGLGMVKCSNNALWALAAGTTAVSGLIAAKVIDGDALMKQGASLFNQASSALGFDDVPVSRDGLAAHLAPTPS